MGDNIYNEKNNRYYWFGGEKFPIMFKIYYGDYNIFQSTKGSTDQLKEQWDLAPKHNIQVVVLIENSTTNKCYTQMVYSGFDYYTFNGSRFLFTNSNPKETILYGRWAETYNIFRKIFNNAISTKEVADE